MAALRGWPSFPEELPDFDPETAPDAPWKLFLQWLTDAGQHGLAPHAVTLSTVDADGAPDARVVMLKEVDENGWYIASGSDSPKGRQLAGEPRAALTSFWPRRARQVRMRGVVSTMPPEVSAADFLARPPASRVEALVGHQSEVLDDPEDLVRRRAEAAEWVRAHPDGAPGWWTRYAVRPDTVEFWQGRHDRRHVRLRYRVTGDGSWERERLWP